MNLEVLLSSKEEYTRQFINLTKPFFVQGLKSIYANVKENNKQSRMILREFQGALRTVPQWSTHILEFEEGRIIKGSKCEWLEQLLNAVYVVNVQIMTHVANGANGTKQRARLNVEVPTLRSFIHKCYISIAREIWKQPYIVYHLIDKVEYQKNMADLDGIVDKLIREVIRQSLPYQELLGHFLGSRITNHVSSAQESSGSEDNESDSDTNSDTNDDDDVVSKGKPVSVCESVNNSDGESTFEEHHVVDDIDACVKDMAHTMQAIDEKAAASPIICPVTPRLPPADIPQSADGFNIIMTDDDDDDDFPMLDRITDDEFVEPTSPLVYESALKEQSSPKSIEFSLPQLNNTSVISRQEPVVSYQEPVVVLHEPMVSYQEPVVSYQEPIMARQEPVMVRQEPIMARQEPIMARQEPVMVRQEPIMVRQEPIMVRQEPVMVRQEPEPVMVRQEMSNSLLLSNETPRINYAPRNSTVKEIVINTKRPTSSSSRMRAKIENMFGHNVMQNISHRDIKENPKLVRRMLLKQLVDA
jgi:hypothetical protein